MAKISKRVIDRLRTPEKRRWLWDDTLKGFGLALRPTGVHSFVFNYRDRYGRLRNVTIGKIGGLTPDAARKKAEEHRRAVVEGRDPVAEKSAAKAAPTVGDLLDRYLECEAFSKKATTTQAVDRGRIEAHLRTLLGKTKLPALATGDIARAHRKIVAGETAVTKPSGKKRGRIRIRGGEGTARMAIRLLRAIIGWGRRAKIVPKELSLDVMDGVDIGRDGRRDLILDDPASYARIWKVLDRLTSPDELKEGEKPLRKEVADAIRVIALTGAGRALRRVIVDVYNPTGVLTNISIFDANDGSWSGGVTTLKDQWVRFTASRPAKATAWTFAFGCTTSESKDGQAFYMDNFQLFL